MLTDPKEDKEEKKTIEENKFVKTVSNAFFGSEDDKNRLVFEL